MSDEDFPPAGWPRVLAGIGQKVFHPKLEELGDRYGWGFNCDIPKYRLENLWNDATLIASEVLKEKHIPGVSPSIQPNHFLKC